MKSRSLKLQEAYIKKHGKVGQIVARSKKLRNRRYYLLRKAKPFSEIIASQKTIYLLEPGEVPPQIKKLQAEFGYTIQTKIL